MVNDVPQTAIDSYTLGSSHAWDFSDTLDRLKVKYQATGNPVEVNFRKLVPLHAGIDRATHLVHSYPAKLLLNIPLFFLRCKQVGTPGWLFDPFCGSGTVMVEGALNGWHLSGADVNPLARLITKVKLTYLEVESIEKALDRVCKASQKLRGSFSPVVDVDLWFSKAAQRQIGGLVEAIKQEPDAEIRQFMLACLSSCVRKASYADPRLSVPVRTKCNWKEKTNVKHTNVGDYFIRSVRENGKRVAKLVGINSDLLGTLTLFEDARVNPFELPDEEDIDLVITSPPYVGAQKYIRASSLSIGWLGLAPENKLRPLELISIGREHYPRAEYSEPKFPADGLATEVLERIMKINPLRAHIASTYLQEMRDALVTTVRRLKRGGRLILIIGNNTISGEKFESSKYVSQIVTSLGLDLELELLDDIRSRGLMTKRNRTAGVITQEHIQMFVKL